MSHLNYITDLLELKDNNIKFLDDCYCKENIKGIIYKVFEGYLSYKPDYCPKCGVVFDDKFEKHGFLVSDIKLNPISGYHTILRLHNVIFVSIVIKLLLFLLLLLTMVALFLITLNIRLL